MSTAAAATATAPAEVENIGTAEGDKKKVFEGGGLLTKKNSKKVGFSMPPIRLGQAESNPLVLRASSAPLNAPSTATVLSQDPGMRRNVPTAPLLAPQLRVRERTLGRRRAACQKTKVHIIHMHASKYIDHARYTALRTVRSNSSAPKSLHSAS